MTGELDIDAIEARVVNGRGGYPDVYELDDYVVALIAELRAARKQIADLTAERDVARAKEQHWMAERDALAARIEAARADIEITHKAMPKGSRAEIRLASALAALSGATEPAPGTAEDHALVCRRCGHTRGKHAIVIEDDDVEICMEMGCDCPEFASTEPAVEDS